MTEPASAGTGYGKYLPCNLLSKNDLKAAVKNRMDHHVRHGVSQVVGLPLCRVNTWVLDQSWPMDPSHGNEDRSAQPENSVQACLKAFTAGVEAPA